MLDSRQRALRERLESFVIGTGQEPVGFTQRLGRENAWSTTHSARVICEYLRFIFLCAESGHPCTPSDAVDQAWHLHLVYTWSYWNELSLLLERPIHHGPTKGGQDEDAKHHDWYSMTLESYRRLFGEEPPRDIWPLTFEPEPETVRVCRRRFWLVPKRSLVTASLLAAVVLLGGCAAEGDGVSITMFVAFLAVGAFVLIAAILSDEKGDRPRRGSSTSDSGGLFTDSSTDSSSNTVGEHGGTHSGSHAMGHDAGSHGGSHDAGGHGGGHGCGGHGCGGHGCGGHG